MEDKTIVIFRKFEDDGSIIAIFPEIPGTNNRYTCNSYVHIGQHGSCDPYGLVEITKLAKPEEYKDLYDELTRIGYDLVVRQKITDKMHNKRYSELAAYQ